MCAWETDDCCMRWRRLEVDWTAWEIWSATMALAVPSLLLLLLVELAIIACLHYKIFCKRVVLYLEKLAACLKSVHTSFFFFGLGIEVFGGKNRNLEFIFHNKEINLVIFFFFLLSISTVLTSKNIFISYNFITWFIFSSNAKYFTRKINANC